jgi:hypothetical protein
MRKFTNLKLRKPLMIEIQKINSSTMIQKANTAICSKSSRPLVTPFIYKASLVDLSALSNLNIADATFSHGFYQSLLEIYQAISHSIQEKDSSALKDFFDQTAYDLTSIILNKGKKVTVLSLMLSVNADILKAFSVSQSDIDTISNHITSDTINIQDNLSLLDYSLANGYSVPASILTNPVNYLSKIFPDMLPSHSKALQSINHMYSEKPLLLHIIEAKGIQQLLDYPFLVSAINKQTIISLIRWTLYDVNRLNELIKIPNMLDKVLPYLGDRLSCGNYKDWSFAALLIRINSHNAIMIENQTLANKASEEISDADLEKIVPGIYPTQTLTTFLVRSTNGLNLVLRQETLAAKVIRKLTDTDLRITIADGPYQGWSLAALLTISITIKPFLANETAQKKITASLTDADFQRAMPIVGPCEGWSFAAGLFILSTNQLSSIRTEILEKMAIPTLSDIHFKKIVPQGLFEDWSFAALLALTCRKYILTSATSVKKITEHIRDQDLFKILPSGPYKGWSLAAYLAVTNTEEISLLTYTAFAKKVSTALTYVDLSKTIPQGQFMNLRVAAFLIQTSTQLSLLARNDALVEKVAYILTDEELRNTAALNNWHTAICLVATSSGIKLLSKHQALAAKVMKALTDAGLQKTIPAGPFQGKYIYQNILNSPEGQELLSQYPSFAARLAKIKSTVEAANGLQTLTASGSLDVSHASSSLFSSERKKSNPNEQHSSKKRKTHHK